MVSEELVCKIMAIVTDHESGQSLAKKLEQVLVQVTRVSLERDVRSIDEPRTTLITLISVPIVILIGLDENVHLVNNPLVLISKLSTFKDVRTLGRKSVLDVLGESIVFREESWKLEQEIIYLSMSEAFKGLQHVQLREKIGSGRTT